MSEQTQNNGQLPDQLTDILLVMDKEKKKIQAVTGVDRDGKLQTADADEKNKNQFMRVDKNGDLFSNFFSNFISQLKNPSRFGFFKVAEKEVLDIAGKLQQQIDKPSKEGEKLMAEYEVKPEAQKEIQQENHNNMATTQNTPEAGEYRYKPEQIDWETMSNLGLSKERLEKLNLLDPLLRGYKTDELVSVNLNFGTVIARTDARLSLQPGDNGQTVVAIHGVRKEPALDFPFFGHEFSKEDKENLLKTGNMGRIVNLTNHKTGEDIPSIISVDRLTNELVALRADKIKIPDEIKNLKLNDAQKQTLMEGKPLYLEGMISKKGQPFNAEVQFNADKRFVEFLFGDRGPQQQQSPQQKFTNGEPPKEFRGKELNDEQYQKLKEGQTVYLPDLKDRKGETYKGYIKLNKDEQKIDFSFQNPDKLREKVQPAEEHKTQTAVNSEGKTNEPTKNLREPLKSGQKTPANKSQQRQQKADAPAKSRGRKM